MFEYFGSFSRQDFLMKALFIAGSQIYSLYYEPIALLNENATLA